MLCRPICPPEEKLLVDIILNRALARLYRGLLYKLMGASTVMPRNYT